VRELNEWVSGNFTTGIRSKAKRGLGCQPEVRFEELVKMVARVDLKRLQETMQ